MTLSLDDRQRAMLAEMGIRLFEALPPSAPEVALAAPGQPAGVSGGSPARASVPPTPSVPAPAPSALRATPTPTGVPAAADAAPLGPRPAGVEAMDWATLEQAVSGCEACGLCRGRRQTVFGTGDRQADWMIVGEAPGEQEDLRGEPFVGNAGQLLDSMLKAIGLDRGKRVYIANVIKCRPPGNRNPDPAEVAQCEPFLRQQIALVKPRIILAMGRFAVQTLLATQEPIGKLRGRIYQYEGVPVVVTYHPAYLLRNLPDKAKAWADLCLALDHLPTEPA
jgi:uracil-DNA glycosylase family 4